MTDEKDINEELDSIILDFFSTLDSLYKSQSILGEDLKGGFLQMSRARYSMGVKSVGISQCDENKMVAQYKVHTDDENTCREKSECDDMFVLEKVKPQENCQINKEDEDGGIKVETVGLRQRKIKKEDTEDKTDTNLNDESLPKNKNDGSGDLAKKKTVNTDPIKWFGVLVPSSLRQSQTHFKNAIQQVVTVANLKQKLLKLQKQYVTCLSQKTEKMNLTVE